MATVDIRPFEPGDGEAVARLAGVVEWPSLTDPDVVRRVCAAPGSVAYVAEHRLDQAEEADGAAGPDAGPAVVGWAQALGDGVLQSHLSFLAVHPDQRGRGIARLLVVATFQATRTKRMDLVTDSAAGFYTDFPHKPMAGFRIYPGA